MPFRPFVTAKSACVLILPPLARALVRWKGRVCGWQPPQRYLSEGKASEEPLEVTELPRFSPSPSRECHERGCRGPLRTGPARAGHRRFIPPVWGGSGSRAPAMPPQCGRERKGPGKGRKNETKSSGQRKKSGQRKHLLSTASPPRPAPSGRPRAP